MRDERICPPFEHSDLWRVKTMSSDDGRRDGVRNHGIPCRRASRPCCYGDLSVYHVLWIHTAILWNKTNFVFSNTTKSENIWSCNLLKVAVIAWYHSLRFVQQVLSRHYFFLDFNSLWIEHHSFVKLVIFAERKFCKSIVLTLSLRVNSVVFKCFSHNSENRL